MRATSSKPKPKHGPRIGLALAGGGPLGAIYEIGALCALDETLVGVDFNQLTGYVGVSAGSFIAAGLANGITPRELYRSFIEDDAEAGELFSASLLMQPAWREFGRRAAALPGLAARAALQLLLHPRSPLSAVECLGSAMPTGLFSGEPMQAQLQRLFAKPGRSNDFRRLKHKLVIVATDLDSGESAPFGLPGWDHVPISRARRRPAPRCPACTRRWRSTTTTLSTAR